MESGGKQVGSFQETLPIDVFKWVIENTFSGVMALAREEIKKSITFERGKPISARSNITEESLGAILLREGRMTSEELSQSLRMIQENEAVQQGEALITMGLIDHALLNEILRKQLISRIQEVFQWGEGRYALIPGIPDDTGRLHMDEGLMEILFRGLVQKHKDSKGINAFEMDAKPVLVGGQDIDVSQLKLVGREMGIFRSITGVVSVKDILAKSRLDEGVAWAMLLAFQDIGLIRIGEPRIEIRQTVKREGEPVRAGKTEASKKVVPSNEFMADVQKRLEASEKVSLYELLGVDEKASRNDIKKTYFQLAKTYHPDRLGGDIVPEDRRVVEMLFAKMSDAQATLTSDESRKEYDASRNLERNGLDAAKAHEILKSEMEFQQGQNSIRKGNFGLAIELLTSAIEKYDQEPEYFLYLGWAQYRDGAKKKNTAGMRKGKQAIEKAIKDQEKLFQGLYFLGMIAKSEGDTEKAKRYFLKTLDAAPKHVEASSELRVLNLRQEKQQSGGLKGLFRKKE